MPASNVNTEVLEDGLQRLRALAPVEPAVSAAIRSAMLEAPDDEVRRINPLRFAQERGLDANQVVDAMIAGAKAGVLEMRWALTCPTCGLYVSQMRRLQEMKERFYCSACDLTSAATLDKMVEVAFQPSQKVRAVPEVELDGKTVADYFQHYRNPAMTMHPLLQERIFSNIRNPYALRPGESVTQEADLRPGVKYRISAISHDMNAYVELPEGKRGVRLVLRDDRWEAPELLDTPTFDVTNESRHQAFGSLIQSGVVKYDDIPPRERVKFAPYLSGRDLLCNQVFRDLFGAETLSAGIALQVESLTVLFTDLKGSTALYDSIGDVRAFSLVSEHFKILLAAVHEHGGAVVKTIGDAVMGAFPTAKSAMQAAVDMARKLESFNATSGLPPLSLKIGLHTGPCIVVNSNQRLDYFGQTVNVAARVQGLAEGDEIVVTDTAWGRPGVASLAEQHALNVETSLQALKGVGERVKVHTLRWQAASA